MWHASAGSRALGPEALELILTTKVLRGVGDPALGQWSETNTHDASLDITHVRRRCTPSEEMVCGPVRDLRDTSEHRKRAIAIHRRLGLPMDFLKAEGRATPEMKVIRPNLLTP